MVSVNLAWLSGDVWGRLPGTTYSQTQGVERP